MCRLAFTNISAHIANKDTEQVQCRHVEQHASVAQVPQTAETLGLATSTVLLQVPSCMLIHAKGCTHPNCVRQPELSQTAAAALQLSSYSHDQTKAWK